MLDTIYYLHPRYQGFYVFYPVIRTQYDEYYRVVFKNVNDKRKGFFGTVGRAGFGADYIGYLLQQLIGIYKMIFISGFGKNICFVDSRNIPNPGTIFCYIGNKLGEVLGG